MRHRWNAGDRWARAAACACPDRAAGAGDWSFLQAEPWRNPRPRERAAGYPSRAAGVTENFEMVRRTICGQPGWSKAASIGRTVLALDETARLVAGIVQAYGLARSASFGILPAVSTSQIAAVFDALDGMLALCAQRAAGLRGDSLRALATAIDIVGNGAVAASLYALATVVGASGLMAKVVGVIATAQIGAAIAAVVGVCQGLRSAGVPNQLRQVARELDAQEAASIPSIPVPGGTFGMLPGQLPTWEGPIKDAPAVPTTTGGGGAAIAGIGALGLGLFLLKGAL